MKFWAIILARGGSKRLPGKNIKYLNGKPLIAYSIESALESSLIDRVIVSTDDYDIASISKNHGAEVWMRSEKYSGDYVSSGDVYKYIYEVALSKGDLPDAFILFQPTQPYRTSEIVNEVIEKYIAIKDDFSSLLTVSINSRKIGRISNNEFLPNNYVLGERSQDLQETYYENGCLYITSISEVKKGLVMGKRLYAHCIPEVYSEIDIDTDYDFKKAEVLLKLFKENY